MLENQKKDKRYTRSLELLGIHLGHVFEIVLEERPEMENPHLFDKFYEGFGKIIQGLQDEEGQVLLNLSSGPPSMKGALQVIAAMASKKLEPVQVASPQGANKNVHENNSDYDVALFWGCNDDNTVGGPNRCSISKTENLNAKIKKEIILRHIDAYDYNAALTVAQPPEDFLPEETCGAIGLARKRVTLDPENIKALKKQKLYFVQTNPKYAILIEGILWLKLKNNRKEYVDFVRRITPVVTMLFGFCLKNTFGIDKKDYSSGERLDINRFKKNPDLDKLIEKKYNKLTNCYISSDILSVLIEAQTAENEDQTEIKRLVKDLNEIDGRALRHIAAHTLKAITENTVKEATKALDCKNYCKSCKDILGLIMKLARLSGVNTAVENWNAYEKMNERLKEEVV